ncbi:MAG: hypothetical protein HY661_18280 [Betaproteobacteria bacterium]|nr:hypothetical protein [Betaproteobacteria bacterium]
MHTPPPDDHFANPETTGFTFEERTGDPDSFSAGIGRVVLNFSELESQLSAAIASCLKLDPSVGRIVTSEISFAVKMHMLSSLTRHLATTRTFNVGRDDPIDGWAKISAQCFRAEELRNQIMHSQWSGPYLRDMKAVRHKFTAKASRGLAEHTEIVTSARLLDIADYIGTVAYFVEEFFYDADEDTEPTI